MIIFNKKSNKGFSLIEVMLGMAVLTIAMSAILVTYLVCFSLIDTVKNINIATNFAQGAMEGIRNSPFPTDENGDGVPDITDLVITHNDINYFFVQDSNSTYLYRCNIPIDDVLPSGECVIYINYDYDNDNSAETDLLEVTVSICWRQRGRAIGEDANLNGILDSGEDENGNGLIDSSVQLKTRWANR